VVTKLLGEQAERRGLLSDGQCGSRKRRSAIDEAANMVNRAHAAWGEGSLAGVLLMDIKAAFPGVRRGRLVHTMNGMGIQGGRIRWTASVLSDRNVEMVIEGNVIERRLVEAVMPQGLPVSPILFAIYTCGLITWVEVRVSTIEGLTLVDDIGWMATGSDLSQVVRKLESYARESIDWAERRELEFDTTKTEAALFSPR